MSARAHTKSCTLQQATLGPAPPFHVYTYARSIEPEESSGGSRERERERQDREREREERRGEEKRGEETETETEREQNNFRPPDRKILHGIQIVKPAAAPTSTSWLECLLANCEEWIQTISSNAFNDLAVTVEGQKWLRCGTSLNQFHCDVLISWKWLTSGD